MIIAIIGAIIGALVLGVGIYYFIKDKKDAESRKIYGTISAIGAAVVIGTVIRIIFLSFAK